MQPTDELVLELSKKKIALLVILACAFVALGSWLLTLDDAFIQSQRRFNSAALVHAIGLVGVLFFGACGLFGLKKIFDAKPGLVFSRSGFLDNASGVSAGFVPWSEVIGFEILEIHRQKMLVVRVKDPERYVERGSSFKRALNRMNHRMCGSPIVISANTLKTSFSDLVSTFSHTESAWTVHSSRRVSVLRARQPSNVSSRRESIVRLRRAIGIENMSDAR